jgi:hypothetical protein
MKTNVDSCQTTETIWPVTSFKLFIVHVHGYILVTIGSGFLFWIQNFCLQISLLVITFLTTLTPLARVVLRNDASPSDGDNKRLVCARGDQCHDHIKDPTKIT